MKITKQKKIKNSKLKIIVFIDTNYNIKKDVFVTSIFNILK